MGHVIELRHALEGRLAFRNLVTVLPVDRVDLGGRRISMATVGFRAERAFSPSTLRAFMAIADQEAIAIDRARAHKSVEERARFAVTLREVAEKIISSGARDALFEVMLDATVKI